MSILSQNDEILELIREFGSQYSCGKSQILFFKDVIVIMNKYQVLDVITFNHYTNIEYSVADHTTRNQTSSKILSQLVSEFDTNNCNSSTNYIYSDQRYTTN